MKNITLIISIFFISSCYNSLINGGLENSDSTITGTNFRYISKVQGQASCERVFNIRIQPGDIYARAMADITKKRDFYHDLKTGLINITYDYRVDYYFLFYSIETVTLTADVVEYLD